MSPKAISEHIFYPTIGERGLPVDTVDDLVVQFVFVDNGEKQNQFQGESLILEWTFVAEQGEDVEK